MEKLNTSGIQFVIRKHRIKEGEAPIYAASQLTQRTQVTIF